MYLVVIEKYLGPPQIMVFESKADFDRRYQRSWGKIVDEGISRESAQKLYGATDPKPLEEKMSDNSYIAVFEYTKMTGGFYKLRTRTDYKDKAEFDAMYQVIPETILVGEGVSEHEAEKLLASVPAVCLYTAAVEKLFEVPTDEVTFERLEWVIENANFAARHATKDRIRLGIENIIDDDFINHLNELCEGISYKAKVMNAIIWRYRKQLDFMPEVHFFRLP